MLPLDRPFTRANQRQALYTKQTMLSDSDSGDESDHQITINEHFAKAYARKKEREELSKCMWVGLKFACEVK